METTQLLQGIKLLAKEMISEKYQVERADKAKAIIDFAEILEQRVNGVDESVSNCNLADVMPSSREILGQAHKEYLSDNDYEKASLYDRGGFEGLQQMAALQASMTAYDDIRTFCRCGYSKEEIQSHCETMLNALIEQSKNLKPNELKGVSNNEQKKELINPDCGAPYACLTPTCLKNGIGSCNFDHRD